MKIEVDASTLKAVALAASTETPRYYLNGVYVSLSASGVRLAATDGKIMLASYDTTYRQDKAQGIIIPNATLKAFKPSKHQKTVELEQIKDDKWRLGDQLFTPVDGTFPDYRRVIPASTPKKLDHEGYHFATKDLAVFEKVSELLDMDYTIAPDGGEAALVRFYNPARSNNTVFIDAILGVIMPVRTTPYQGVTKTPAWVNIP